MPLAILLAAALLIFFTPSAQAEPLMLCGDDTVFVVDMGRDKIAKVWTWKAIECAQLSEAMRGTFATTDDCKPLDGGLRVLVSSSSGGCAVVERPSGKAIWSSTKKRKGQASFNWWMWE